jgi:hypothetical protein
MGIACDPFRENVPIIPESKKRRLPAPHIKGSARKEEYLRVGLLVRDDLARNGSTRGGWNPSELIGNISEADWGFDARARRRVALPGGRE